MRGIVSFSVFFVLSVIPVQAQKTDSLLRLLPKTSGEERVVVLNEITVRSWLNFPEEAMAYAREAYQLSLISGNNHHISKSLRLIGGVHYYMGNYDSSLYYNRESLRIATELNDPELMNGALNNIGLLYYSFGSYHNALEHLLRSLNLKISTGAEYGKGITLNNIGLVYSELKDYKKARDYYLKALEVGKQQQDMNIILYSQNNIAQTYLDEGRIDEAEKYFSLSLALPVDNTNWKATAFSGMGKAEHAKGNYLLSNQYFDKAMNLRRSIGDKHGISEVYYFFSRAESEKSNFAKALEFLNQSQEIAQQINRRERIMQNYQLYSDIYANSGDEKQAFYYQTKFLNLRDSLFNENLARNLADIHLKLQEDESSRIISMKDQQLAYNRNFTITLVVVVLLSVALSLMIHYAYKANKRVNGILAERNQEILNQKREIELQKEELVINNVRLEGARDLIKEQNKRLAMLNMKLRTRVDKRTQQLESANKSLALANLELDNFIYKSSHDIRGPLATLMGVCNVAMIDVKEEKAREYLFMLQQTANNLNDILSRLKTVSDINGRDLKIQKINLSKVITKCFEQTREMHGAKSILLKKRVNKELNFRSDPLLMDIIFYNLIQNAIRFQDPSQEENIIDVSVTSNSCELLIDFRDNGIGIKEHDSKNVFEMFSKAANKHQSIGLGLYIVKQSVQKLGGDIILTEDPEMTHFRLRMPLVREEVPQEFT